MAEILFSEAGLRYFLLNFGQKLIEEYTETPIDDEDLYVLEALLSWELGLLHKAEKNKRYNNEKIINTEDE